MFNLGYCKFELPRPSVDLKTGGEIPSLLVHWKHSRKRSFWKESKATSHHHFPPCPSGQVWGLTDKVFSFRPLKAVNIRPQLPVAYHMVSTDTFLLKTANITLLLWPRFCFPNRCSYGTHPWMFYIWHRTSCLRGSFLSPTTQEMPSNRHKISPVLHLALTTPLRIRSSYPNLQDEAITHDCHDWAQVTNMCQLSTTLRLASGYRSSWSFSSLPPLTLTATGTSGERLIYGEVILLHRLCLQHVFTLQVLLLDPHQRVQYWNRSGRMLQRLSQPVFTPVI